MPLINSYTILIMTGVLHLLVAAAGLLIRSQNDTKAIIRLWVVAQFICGSTQLLRLMQFEWSPFWSSTFPNTGFALGFALSLLAVIRLFKLAEKTFLIGSLFVLVLHLTLRNFGLLEPNRLAFVSALYATQFCQAVYFYGQVQRQHKTQLLTVLQLGNLLVVMTAFARIVEATGSGADYAFQNAGLGQTLALLGVFASVAINGFSFLLLLIERGGFELTRLSTLDSLTETLNRRSFLEVAHQQVALATRNLQPVSILMCDLDHFKKINDRFGHLAGDQIIKSLVAAAQRTMRSGDRLGRWGGEEFILLLPYTQRSGAEQLAQRLNRAFAQSTIKHDGKPLSTTVSIGVAQHDPDEPIQTTIDRADQALLRAKSAGRNRVEVG